MAAITWVNQVNVSLVGTTLTKNGGSEGTTDAGATSQEVMSANGEFAFTVPNLSFAAVGLGTSSSLMSAMALNRAFFIYDTGTVEIREVGVYKTETSYIATDTFTVTRDGSSILYKKNGTLIYTGTDPGGDLYAQAIFANLGSSLTNGTLSGVSSSVPTLPAPTPVSGTSAPTSYPNAISDRAARAKPVSVPTPPALHGIYVDALFGRNIRRETDGTVGSAGSLNKSHHPPSSEVVSMWSSDSTQLYLTTPNGVVELFSVDAAQNGRLTYIRDLTYNNEPTFSRVTAKRLYGSTGYVIRQHDTVPNTYTDILDLTVLDPAYTGGGLVVGGVQSSSSSPERLALFYGGSQQDEHFRVMTVDSNNTANRLIMDTMAGTINGVAVAMDNFHLHTIGIDLSGRYVILYSTYADRALDPTIAQIYIWDTAQGIVTPIPDNLFPYGHVGYGFGDMVNQDSGNVSPFDAFQWHYRAMNDVANPTPVIIPPITPQMIYMGDHPVWTNARADIITPFLTATGRYYEDNADNLEVGGIRTNTVPYRAGDNEVVHVHPITGALYRWCHHRANVYTDDGSGINNAFWYQPMAHPSPDGRFIAFGSNFEKTLGLDAAGSAALAYRIDTWIIDTQESIGNPTPPPPVTPNTLVINGPSKAELKNPKRSTRRAD